MSHTESRFVQQQICQRIGSLKRLERLERLNIGLYGPYMDDLDPLVVILVVVCPIQYQCLKLSLETGLEALAGLKGLRDLKIANMGAQEIGWMVREGVWPKLELNRGCEQWHNRNPFAKPKSHVNDSHGCRSRGQPR